MIKNGEKTKNHDYIYNSKPSNIFSKYLILSTCWDSMGSTLTLNELCDEQ